MRLLEKPTSRRRFLAGSATAAASTVMLNGVNTRLAFATPQNPDRGDVVVVVFLRFGADGLSLTPPIGAAYDTYSSGRPDLRITPDQALSLDDSNTNAVFPQGLSGVVGFHPAFSGLYESAWARGQMAVLPFSGMPNSESDTRSHFQAQQHMELGTANVGVSNGWLTRVMEGQAPGGTIAGVTTSSSAAQMYRGSTDAFSVPNLATFGVRGFRSANGAFEVLSDMYQGGGQINTVGASTLQAATILAAVDAEGGEGYPDTGIGRDLRDVANLIRSDVGMTTAMVSYGGWDHHSEQGTLNGQFNTKATELNGALTAFVNDLGSAIDETTIFVVSEFGRTNRQNSAQGTDHGRAGTSFIIGGGIQGGVYGYDYPDAIESLPSARQAQTVLTDYRKAFDEVLQGRVGVTGSFPTLQNDQPDLGLLR